MRAWVPCCMAAVAVGLSGCGEEAAEPAEPKVVLTDNALGTARDSLVDWAVRAYAAKRSTAGLSIGLIEGRRVWVYDYGETLLGEGTLPDSDTVYEIGSLTKSFTAAATVVWLEEGGVGLDAPVAGFLPAACAPGLERDGAQATFRELLDHTSGLPRVPEDLGMQPGYSAEDPYRGYDSTRVLAYVASHPPVYTPGTPPTAGDVSDAYSNLAYGLTGILLERQTKMAFETVVRARICEPLGLGATGMTRPAANLAYPHDARGRVVPFWDFAGFAGAGALYSSIHDLAIFARAQLGLSPGPLDPVFALCQTPSVTVDGRDVFGLGWEFRYLRDGRRITVKDGGTGGSTCFLALDRPRGRALIWLSNNSLANGAPGAFATLLEAFFTP